MAKKVAHQTEVIMEEGPDDGVTAESGITGGGERDWKWKAKLILFSIVVATVLRFVDKPIASVIPSYPIVDNISTYYNWAFDHTLGFAGKLIYSQ